MVNRMSMGRTGLVLVALGMGVLSFGCKGGKGKDKADAAPSASAAPTSTEADAHRDPPTPGDAPTGVLAHGSVAPLSFSSIVKGADPSVVTIATMEIGPNGRKGKGLGTGFIIDKDGTILTNNHVIRGAETISVRTSDDREFNGDIIGRDPRTDIAVIRIKAKGLKPIPLGDSEKADVGDWVVAIGNPFGLSHTVSAGIVSGKGRSRDDVPLDPSGYYDFIQTDASINPGNSGGPLLNLSGEVVGINTAIRGGGAQGIGFAIPMAMVKQLLPMLLRDGHVTRSALGIQIKDVRELPDERRARLRIGDDHGALVEFVAPGSAAAKAKLEPGDVIVAFEGQAIDKATRLQWLASTAGVGKTVVLKVSHSGEVADRKVTLGELDEPKGRGEAPAKGGGGGSPFDDDDH